MGDSSVDQMAVFASADFRADLALLQQSTASAARRFAADARLLARMAATVPPPIGTRDGALAWQSFVREVAVARRVHDAQAQGEVQVACRLVACHPRTLALLTDGAVTVGRARALVEELSPVDAGLAAVVDGELADRLVVLQPWRIRQEARRVVDRLDADAAALRAAKAALQRGVRRSALRDGQAEVVVTGPAVPLVRWHQALTDAARARRAQGDPRGVDALRFDLLVAGFTGAAAPPTDGTQPDVDHESTGSRSPVAGSAAGSPVAGSAAGFPVTGSAAAGSPVAGSAAGFPVASTADRDAARQGAALGDPAAQDVADRSAARTAAERLSAGEPSSDRRAARPVQVLVHVPVATALGLADDPGWLEGYGWLSAPQCRQLLPDAELRQVCTTRSGQVLDQAARRTRPEATPDGAREALLVMVRDPFELTAAPIDTSLLHDPPDSVADLVRLRDRFCDGPTSSCTPASRCDLDHDLAYPEGPTAAWNLAARNRRTHRLKHAGWRPLRTTTGTTWFSPAGQIVHVPHHNTAPPDLDDDACLPDATALHQLEVELCRPPGPDDEPPF